MASLVVWMALAEIPEAYGIEHGLGKNPGPGLWFRIPHQRYTGFNFNKIKRDTEFKDPVTKFQLSSSSYMIPFIKSWNGLWVRGDIDRDDVLKVCAYDKCGNINEYFAKLSKCIQAYNKAIDPHTDCAEDEGFILFPTLEQLIQAVY